MSYSFKVLNNKVSKKIINFALPLGEQAILCL